MRADRPNASWQNLAQSTIPVEAFSRLGAAGVERRRRTRHGSVRRLPPPCGLCGARQHE